MPMDRLPVINTAEDVPAAIEFTKREPSAKWYVIRRALALRAGGMLPSEWESLVATAQPGGRYPIEDRESLHNAIQAFGRSKTPESTKAHIIREAKRLGLTDMLPESWAGSTKPVAASGRFVFDESGQRLADDWRDPEDEIPELISVALDKYAHGEGSMNDLTAVIASIPLDTDEAAALSQRLEDNLLAELLDRDETDTIVASFNVDEALVAGTRHVRTPGGAQQYGEPIGAEITKDAPKASLSLPGFGKGYTDQHVVGYHGTGGAGPGGATHSSHVVRGISSRGEYNAEIVKLNPRHGGEAGGSKSVSHHPTAEAAAAYIESKVGKPLGIDVEGKPLAPKQLSNVDLKSPQGHGYEGSVHKGVGDKVLHKDNYDARPGAHGTVSHVYPAGHSKFGQVSVHTDHNGAVGHNDYDAKHEDLVHDTQHNRNVAGLAHHERMAKSTVSGIDTEHHAAEAEKLRSKLAPKADSPYMPKTRAEAKKSSTPPRAPTAAPPIDFTQWTDAQLAVGLKHADRSVHGDALKAEIARRKASASAPSAPSAPSASAGKSSKEVAAAGGSASEIRAALREEHPDWKSQQVATVAARMEQEKAISDRMEAAKAPAAAPAAGQHAQAIRDLKSSLADRIDKLPTTLETDGTALGSSSQSRAKDALSKAEYLAGIADKQPNYEAARGYNHQISDQLRKVDHEITDRGRSAPAELKAAQDKFHDLAGPEHRLSTMKEALAAKKADAAAAAAKSPSFVSGKSTSLGEVVADAKKGDEHHGVPKQTLGDGSKVSVGSKVTDKNGNVGEVTQTYQSYGKVKWNDGRTTTVHYDKLNNAGSTPPANPSDTRGDAQALRREDLMKERLAAKTDIASDNARLKGYSKQPGWSWSQNRGAPAGMLTNDKTGIGITPASDGKWYDTRGGVSSTLEDALAHASSGNRKSGASGPAAGSTVEADAAKAAKAKPAADVKRPATPADDAVRDGILKKLHAARALKNQPEVDRLTKKLRAHNDKFDRSGLTVEEEQGRGHEIPDLGNVVRVRTHAQKIALEEELKGQMSDGMWENSYQGPPGMEAWKKWGDANIIVDPKNVGRNFNVYKDNYNLNSKSLLDIVGDRVIEEIKKRTGDSSYDRAKLNKDLADLKKIMKTQRHGAP